MCICFSKLLLFCFLGPNRPVKLFRTLFFNTLYLNLFNFCCPCNRTGFVYCGVVSRAVHSTLSQLQNMTVNASNCFTKQLNLSVTRLHVDISLLCSLISRLVSQGFVKWMNTGMSSPKQLKQISMVFVTVLQNFRTNFTLIITLNLYDD